MEEEASSGDAVAASSGDAVAASSGDDVIQTLALLLPLPLAAAAAAVFVAGGPLNEVSKIDANEAVGY